MSEPRRYSFGVIRALKPMPLRRRICVAIGFVFTGEFNLGPCSVDSYGPPPAPPTQAIPQPFPAENP